MHNAISILLFVTLVSLFSEYVRGPVCLRKKTEGGKEELWSPVSRKDCPHPHP